MYASTRGITGGRPWGHRLLHRGHVHLDNFESVAILVTDGEHRRRLWPAQHLADVDAAAPQVGLHRLGVGGGEPDAGLDAARHAVALRDERDRHRSVGRCDLDPTPAQLLDWDIEPLLETERVDVELEPAILVGYRYADGVYAGNPCGCLVIHLVVLLSVVSVARASSAQRLRTHPSLASSSSVEPRERCRKGLGVLAHPPVVDEPDWDRVQEVVRLAAASLRDHEARLLEHPQVLHDAVARHRHSFLQCAQRLPVLPEERVEQAPTRGVGERLEH